MQIIHNLNALNNSNQIFILGFFDGIHKGHKKIFEKALEIKKKNPQFQITVCTFDKNPISIIRSQEVKNLFTWEERIDFFRLYSIDYVYAPVLNLDFFKQTSEEFLAILLSHINNLHMVLGDEAKFGSDQSGGGEFFEKIQEKYSSRFLYTLIQTKNEDTVKLSSSTLRNSFQQGKISVLNKELLEPVSINGIIIHGNKQGRLIGFPTLNMVYPDTKIVPPFGVYHSLAKIKGLIYHSLTYISNFRLDTVSHTPIVETWVAGFTQEIYDEHIKIYLLDYKRPPIKINSLEELKTLLEADKKSLYK